MADGMFAHLDADLLPSHLVRDGDRRARAAERVEDEISGVGGDLKNSLKQAFRFRGPETYLGTKQTVCFLLRLIRMADICM